MASKQVHFEIYTRRGPKSGWHLSDAETSRETAVKRAEALFEAGEAKGVKVVKETYTEATGEFLSITIFEKGDTADFGRERIKAPAELPCFHPRDLYSIHARSVIARLLADFLTRERITATELMHRADAVERLDAAGTVRQHAIQKAAIAHAGSTNQDVQEIVKKLNDLTDRAVARVYQDHRAGNFPDLAKFSLAQIAKALRGNEDGGYYLAAAIARRLAPLKGWGEKLELLLDLMDHLPAEEEDRELCLSTIDAFVAEMLEGRAALGDLLGRQRNTGDALVLLVDLFRGSMNQEGECGRGVLLLAAEFARNKLPNARRAIVLRVLSELKSVRRLIPDGLEEEVQLCRRMASKMVLGVGDSLSLEEITEAFRIRSKRFVTPDVIETLLQSAADPGEQLEKLILLEENVVGADNKRQLATFVTPLITAHQTEVFFVDGKDHIIRRLTRVAELQTRVRHSGFQDTNKRQISEGLDALAVRMEEKAAFFDLIEKKDLPAPDKAIALLRLVSQHVLTEGELSKRAKVRALKIIRRQGFAEDLAGFGADAQKKAAELMELMRKAGIQHSAGGAVFAA